MKTKVSIIPRVCVCVCIEREVSFDFFANGAQGVPMLSRVCVY